MGRRAAILCQGGSTPPRHGWVGMTRVLTRRPKGRSDAENTVKIIKSGGAGRTNGRCMCAGGGGEGGRVVSYRTNNSGAQAAGAPRGGGRFGLGG